MVTCILARFKSSNYFQIWSNPACPSFANGRPPVLISSGIWHQRLNIVKSTNTVQSGSLLQEILSALQPKNPTGYFLTSFKNLYYHTKYSKVFLRKREWKIIDSVTEVAILCIIFKCSYIFGLDPIHLQFDQSFSKVTSLSIKISAL